MTEHEKGLSGPFSREWILGTPSQEVFYVGQNWSPQDYLPKHDSWNYMFTFYDIDELRDVIKKYHTDKVVRILKMKVVPQVIEVYNCGVVKQC